MNRAIQLFSMFAVVALLAIAPPVAAQQEAPPEPGVFLTVYNQNFALVKDIRNLDLVNGTMTFRDVAATIDPTSVSFRSLTDPEARVIEQNYEFDLVGAEKLLEKYVDRQVTVFTRDGNSYTGTLLSFDNAQLVIREEGGQGPLVMIARGDNIQRIQFGQLPEGLLTRPTLVWEVASRAAGAHLVELSYMASQFNWRADYNLVLHQADKTLDLSGWVTLENKTGTGYPQAQIKLVAGDTRGPDWRHRTLGYGHSYYKTLSELPPTGERGDDPSRQLGEYRLYDLPVRTDVNHNQIKQVELIKAVNVPYRQIYLYDGSPVSWMWGRVYDAPGFVQQENKKVNVLVEFENRKRRNLGIALPQGKARVFARDDADNSLEFIGEDTVPGVPVDEKVVLYIGDAFDIVGERKHTDHTRVAERVIEETFEIKIRNQKENEDVVVEVLEKMVRTADWTVLWSSVNEVRVNHDDGRRAEPQYEKRDARTIVFPVEVKASGETVIRYRVRYRW